MGTLSCGTQPLTIMVFSASYLIRLGLEKIFETEGSVRVVGHSWGGVVLQKRLAEDKPHVAIIDMETECDVIQLIQSIKDCDPTIKIVLLSGFEDRDRTRKAFDQGVDGIILKVQPPAVVLATVHTLMYQPVASQGQANGIPPSVEQAPVGTPVRLDAVSHEWPGALTEREREVIVLVGQGLSNKDIADRLCISAITVRHHLTSIFDKVGVPNRQKLLIRAHGLGSPSP